MRGRGLTNAYDRLRPETTDLRAVPGGARTVSRIEVTRCSCFVSLGAA